LENKLNIAVIAHDGKKADMVAFIMKRLDFFRQVNVVATGTTGKHIEHAGLDVDCLKSGPLGGDAQIASMIADNQISAVIFFIDPLDVHPHQVDVNMLLRICNVYNVPLATNYMTASYIIRGLKNELETIKQ
jgi:methylglyoxal synthase